MSMPRYTCMESALITSPPRAWASSTASPDFPAAVGPTTAITRSPMASSVPPAATGCATSCMTTYAQGIGDSVTIVDGPDRFQRRHAWLGFPLAVVYKFFDDFGTYLSAILTYYAFVSLFPLLLIASTVLSVVLRGNPHLQHELLTSALKSFPVINEELDKPEHLSGGPGGLIIGIVGSVYGALGVAQAFQYASNTMWAVARDSRPNPLHARGRSLVLLAVVGLTILATTTLAILGDGGVGLLGTTEKYLAVAVSVAINATTAVFAFRFAPARKLSIRDVLPGAISA